MAYMDRLSLLFVYSVYCLYIQFIVCIFSSLFVYSVYCLYIQFIVSIFSLLFHIQFIVCIFSLLFVYSHTQLESLKYKLFKVTQIKHVFLLVFQFISSLTGTKLMILFFLFIFLLNRERPYNQGI